MLKRVLHFKYGCTSSQLFSRNEWVLSLSSCDNSLNLIGWNGQAFCDKIENSTLNPHH